MRPVSLKHCPRIQGRPEPPLRTVPRPPDRQPDVRQAVHGQETSVSRKALALRSEPRPSWPPPCCRTRESFGGAWGTCGLAPGRDVGRTDQAAKPPRPAPALPWPDDPGLPRPLIRNRAEQFQEVTGGGCLRRGRRRQTPAGVRRGPVHPRLRDRAADLPGRGNHACRARQDRPLPQGHLRRVPAAGTWRYQQQRAQRVHPSRRGAAGARKGKVIVREGKGGPCPFTRRGASDPLRPWCRSRPGTARAGRRPGGRPPRAPGRSPRAAGRPGCAWRLR